MAIQKITLVVCLYNQSNILRINLPIFMGQKIDLPYEVILTDDGSSQTEQQIYQEILAPYKKQLSSGKLLFITQPDLGFRLAKSRNNALALATGDVIVMIDGDILITTSLLRDHLISHSGRGNKLIYTNRQHRSPSEGLKAEPTTCLNLLQRGQKELETKSMMQPWQRVWGFNKSFSFPQEIRHSLLYDESFVGWGLEDAEFAYRLNKQYGFEIHHNSQVMSYHIHPDTVLNNPYKTLLATDLLRLVKNAIYFHEKYPHDEAIVKNVFPTIPSFCTKTNQVIAPNSKFLLNKLLKEKAALPVSELKMQVYATQKNLLSYLGY